MPPQWWATLKRKFFIYDPLKYVKHYHKMAGYYYLLNKWLFYCFNILTAAAALAAVIITTIIVSKLLNTAVPAWYLYFTTSISAVTALITSLVNFFLLKDNIAKFARRKVLIGAELIKYHQQTEQYSSEQDRAWLLFTTVFTIVTGFNYQDDFNATK